MSAASLDQPTLDLLDERIEVDARTPRRDGSTSSRPIWAVVTDGDAYVRSYHGERGAWYRRALADHAMTIGVDDMEIPVGVEPARGAEIDRRVSDAYRAKYGKRSPGPTETMVNDEVSATTLRLTAP
jgi:hypothetical protein